MTTDLLKEQHDNLKYFKDDLSGVNELIDWVEVRDNPQIMIEFINEMIYINRMNSIGREKEWRAQRSPNSFDYNEMKRRLTNGKSVTNEWGEVKGWGSAMTPEMWEVYEKHYDSIFETEYIE